MEKDKFTFEISQRAPFILSWRSHETMRFRPLLNLRDEPHADPPIKRLHTITGDSNRAQLANYIKVGVSQIILYALMQRIFPNLYIFKPINSFKNISSDPKLKRVINTNKGKYRCIEIMRHYFSFLVEEFKKGNLILPDYSRDVFEWWDRILTDLESPNFVRKTFGKLDWTTKYYYYRELINSSKINSWKDALWIDINYSNLDSERDIYYKIFLNGSAVELINNNIKRLLKNSPPNNTRASLRSEIIKQERDRIEEINWNYIKYKNGKEIYLNIPWSQSITKEVK